MEKSINKINIKCRGKGGYMINKNKIKRNKGFTVVEMLVVIAIIGVMSTFVGVGYFGYVEKSKDAVAKVEAQEIYKAIELSLVDGSFSDYTTIEEVEELEPSTLLELLESECGMKLADDAIIDLEDGVLTYQSEGAKGTYSYK